MIDVGGPEFTISVAGKRYLFEMHPYCGPNVLNRRTGEPLEHQPMPFLEAASLWAQQGQRVEDGLCVWNYKPKKILKHLGGRNYQILGYEQAEKGQ